MRHDVRPPSDSGNLKRKARGQFPGAGFFEFLRRCEYAGDLPDVSNFSSDRRSDSDFAIQIPAPEALSAFGSQPFPDWRQARSRPWRWFVAPLRGRPVRPAVSAIANWIARRPRNARSRVLR